MGCLSLLLPHRVAYRLLGLLKKICCCFHILKNKQSRSFIQGLTDYAVVPLLSILIIHCFVPCNDSEKPLKFLWVKYSVTVWHIQLHDACHPFLAHLYNGSDSGIMGNRKLWSQASLKWTSDKSYILERLMLSIMLVLQRSCYAGWIYLNRIDFSGGETPDV